MNLIRIQRGTTGTITNTFYATGMPSDPGPDSASVQLLRADGTELQAPAAAADAGEGVFSFPLALAHTPLLDRLTARWTAAFDGEPQTYDTIVELVGGFLCPLSRLRAALPDEDDGELLRIRTEAEQRIEGACGKAFVPRYTLESLLLSGDCGRSRIVTRPYTRAVRSITVAGTDYTPEQLAAVEITRFPGRLRCLQWTHARSALVGYEHGLDAPTEDIARAIELYALETYGPDALGADDSRVIRREADNMAVTFARRGDRDRFLTPELNQIINDHDLRALPTLV